MREPTVATQFGHFEALALVALAFGATAGAATVLARRALPERFVLATAFTTVLVFDFAAVLVGFFTTFAVLAIVFLLVAPRSKSICLPRRIVFTCPEQIATIVVNKRLIFDP